MYSLYRAWFGGDDNYARLETLSPPDTLVRVGNEGEYQFVAHRGVLAAHSGYLKALLATAANSNVSATSGGNGAASTVTSVSVSSIGGEAFAPLLNYMYTGRLEVTLDNIYSVLLATHLLHMPGALEQCRTALLRLRGAPLPPVPCEESRGIGNVLRPVPSRLVGPPLCWPQPTLYPSTYIPTLPLPTTISTLPMQIIHETNLSSYSMKENQYSPKPSTSQAQRSQRSRSKSASPEATSSRKTEEANQPEQITNRSPSSSGSSENISVTDNDTPRPQDNSRLSSNNQTTSPNVVFDVACCDGPVRFHRVLNENYAPSSSSSSSGFAVQHQRNCINNDTSGENNENGHPNGNATETNRETGNRNLTYTCSYCKHTFKSRYCYQKHTRRHLLPTEANASGSSQHGGRRREVRLLDLNVQYYPCKICGSKFPSYYFVHKHRKLCHSNAEDAQSGSEETNPARNSSSSDSQ